MTLTQGVHGIEIFSSTAITLSHIRSAGNAFDGARIAFDTDIVVTDSVFDHNGEDGLSPIVNVMATVRDNAIHDNAANGINFAFGGRAEFSGNVIEDNARVGLVVFQDASAVIRDNTVRNSLDHGILVQNNSAAEIIGNRIEAQGLFGVFSISNAMITVTDNTFSQNFVDIGVVVGSTATIARNDMSDSLVGIFVGLQSSAEITDNVIDSTSRGVHLVREDATATLSGNDLSVTDVGLLLEGQGASAVLHSGNFTGSAFAAVEVIGGRRSQWDSMTRITSGSRRTAASAFWWDLGSGLAIMHFSHGRCLEDVGVVFSMSVSGAQRS